MHILSSNLNFENIKLKGTTLITSIVMLLGNQAFSQENFILNGDMENYSECPNSFSTPGDYQVERCTGWTTPTYATSDYLNSCADGNLISIPNNHAGTQTTSSGNGYLAGFFACYSGGGGTDGYSGTLWWEYIQGQLSQPLENGKIYKLSLEVSMAEVSDLMINEIGVYFSDNAIQSANSKPLSIVPQCTFISANYFEDTINWIHLETLYQANGSEKFITIGNFNDSLTTDTIRRKNYLSMWGYSPSFTYFYIDDVKLVDPDWTQPHGPNVFTPNNDGVNDFFTFPSTEMNSRKIVTIVNRWGNMIFESDLTNFIWDGKSLEGLEVTEGTYYYIVSDTNISGFIELIR